MSRYSFDVDGETVYDWRQMRNDLYEMLDAAEDGAGFDSNLAETLVDAIDEVVQMF